MTRIVDPVRKRHRDAALSTIAMASGYVDMMREKSGELLSMTQADVRGHPSGDRIIGNAARMVEDLGAAWASLQRALDATRGIDVTVEIPDSDDY